MPKASGPSELVARWRAEAEVLRAHGALEAAATKDRDASELEVWAKQHALEALTLDQAAAESGYSYSALSKMVSQGRLKNVAGPKHYPRIRRADLPRKLQTSGKAPGLELADHVLRAKANAKAKVGR